nr:ribonuclease H-like domain-containing protein [Tanacetum cinerariifolium]
MVTRAKVGTIKLNLCFHGYTSHISPLPKSPIVALSDSNWRDAMYEKYNALIRISTWILVSKPPNANVVWSMWLFWHKYYANGSLSGYKARLFANGCSQQYGTSCLVLMVCEVFRLLVTLHACFFLKRRAHMASCNPTWTSADMESKLGADEDPISNPTLYRSLAAKWQHTLSRSSVEAENRDVANVVAEIAWIHNLLRDFICHYHLLLLFIVAMVVVHFLVCICIDDFDEFWPAPNGTPYWVPDVPEDENPKKGHFYDNFNDAFEMYQVYSEKARYGYKFVPFTGIDHHQKCVTFSVALLSDETTESFCWMLEAFLKTHKIQPPFAVTDQDGALRNAVVKMFPDSHHRLLKKQEDETQTPNVKPNKEPLYVDLLGVTVPDKVVIKTPRSIFRSKGTRRTKSAAKIGKAKTIARTNRKVPFKQRTCSTCGGNGHNKATCKGCSAWGEAGHHKGICKKFPNHDKDKVDEDEGANQDEFDDEDKFDIKDEVDDEDKVDEE